MRNDNSPQFLLDARNLIFNQKEHTYFFNNKELISVTNFIDIFSWPFDPDKSILNRCAAKRGISPSKLQKEWEKTGTDAASLGNQWHSSIEYYINTGKIRKNKFTDMVQTFIKEYTLNGQVFSETRVFSEELLISGTVDVLEVIDNKYLNVKDWKTNKKIDDWSFGRKMKYPLEHLNDSKLQKYILQVQIYSYLLCSKYGYTPGNDNCIFWIDKKKREIKKYPVEIDYGNVLNMIADYTYKKSLSPEELENLNKSKIIPAQNEIPEWID